MSFSKKQLQKEIRRDEKAKARAVLDALHAEAKSARAERRAAKSDVRVTCGRDRARAIRQAFEAERAEAKASCAESKAAAASLVGVVARRTEAARAELRYQRELRRLESYARARRAEAAPKASRAERRSESDDEVRQNLPASLVPAFERVRGIIKAGPRRSRTEAFLEYAEAHPDLRASADLDAEDALIAEMQSRQNAPPDRASMRGFGGVDTMAIAAIGGAALLLFFILRAPSKAPAQATGLAILRRAA